MKSPREAARDLFVLLLEVEPDDGDTDRRWLEAVSAAIKARDAEHAAEVSTGVAEEEAARVPGEGETWEYTAAIPSLRGVRIRLLARREFNDGWVVGDRPGDDDWEPDASFTDGTLRFVRPGPAAAPAVTPVSDGDPAETKEKP